MNTSRRSLLATVAAFMAGVIPYAGRNALAGAAGTLRLEETGEPLAKITKWSVQPEVKEPERGLWAQPYEDRSHGWAGWIVNERNETWGFVDVEGWVWQWMPTDMPGGEAELKLQWRAFDLVHNPRSFDKERRLSWHFKSRQIQSVCLTPSE